MNCRTRNYKNHKTRYKEEIINMLLSASELVPCKTLISCFSPVDFTYDVLYKDKRGNLWWTNKLAPTEYLPYRKIPAVTRDDSPAFSFNDQNEFIREIAESARFLPNGSQISTNFAVNERLFIYKRSNNLSFRIASKDKKGDRRKPIPLY